VEVDSARFKYLAYDLEYYQVIFDYFETMDSLATTGAR